jgi:hypothetical protein
MHDGVCTREKRLEIINGYVCPLAAIAPYRGQRMECGVRRLRWNPRSDLR